MSNTELEKEIDDLLSRSIKEIIPSKEKLKEKILSGEKLKIYIGTDATGTSLHLGHATNYIILEKFRKLGHEVIFLIGDFTSRIGDPTDKQATRTQLTREEVINNTKTWLNQIRPIINFEEKNNPVKIVYNHDWLSKLTFEDVINISSNFTVQRMLERDMFEKRIKEEKPIYLHEFFYPLMQGYDSLALNVDIEMCGSDQKFNALTGRTLLKKYNKKEKFIIITTLLENPITKEKMMSKSLGTGIFLDWDENKMFGGIMSQPDENMRQLFIDTTFLTLEEIDDIIQKNLPRDTKIILAYEVTKIYHGEIKASDAKNYFIKTVSNKELPDKLKEIKINTDIKLTEFIVLAGLANSNSDARRKIEQGGVEINKFREKNYLRIITKSDNDSVIKVGKFGYAKIIFK
jgi:tyrosyl-tRNA synthetase